MQKTIYLLINNFDYDNDQVIGAFTSKKELKQNPYYRYENECMEIHKFTVHTTIKEPKEVFIIWGASDGEDCSHVFDITFSEQQAMAKYNKIRKESEGYGWHPEYNSIKLNDPLPYIYEYEDEEDFNTDFLEEDFTENDFEEEGFDSSDEDFPEELLDTLDEKIQKVSEALDNSEHEPIDTSDYEYDDDYSCLDTEEDQAKLKAKTFLKELDKGTFEGVGPKLQDVINKRDSGEFTAAEVELILTQFILNLK